MGLWLTVAGSVDAGRLDEAVRVLGESQLMARMDEFRGELLLIAAAAAPSSQPPVQLWDDLAGEVTGLLSAEGITFERVAIGLDSADVWGHPKPDQ